MKGFTKEELLGLAWEKPILAQVEITNKCNQACLFCSTGQKKHKIMPDLNLEQWLIIVTKLRNLGVRRLDFTGRESFMYPDFGALLASCRKMGFEIKINTNGTFDVSRILADVDEIVFSVHGFRANHDRITNNPGSFDLIEANIGKTVNAGVKASINMSLLKSNYHEAIPVFRYFDGKYVIHKFAPAIPVPSLFGDTFEEEELTVDEYLITDYIAKLKSIGSDRLTLKHGFHSIFINNRKHYQDNGLLLPNCAAGKFKLLVESDGCVYPCNFFKSPEFFCGNILTDDEYKIWKSGKGFNIFRNLILGEKIPDDCSNCLKKPRCFSGCRAWSLTYKEGGFENVKDRRCELGSAFIGSGDNNEV